MSQIPDARMHALQPELPILEAEPDATDRTRQTPSDEASDWYLDAHTREVGHRGIAAARTRLRSASGHAA